LPICVDKSDADLIDDGERQSVHRRRLLENLAGNFEKNRLKPDLRQHRPTESHGDKRLKKGNKYFASISYKSYPLKII
jgi:hypothetical protein